MLAGSPPSWAVVSN